MDIAALVTIEKLSDLEEIPLAQLQQIWKWREGQSQMQDIPPFKVMGNNKNAERFTSFPLKSIIKSLHTIYISI